MLNNAVIMGRICNDIELRKTQSGIDVTRFTVAVDRGYVKQGEEKKTDFIPITAWRGTASFINNYFKKGSMIAICGSIQTGSYEKDGIKHNTFEIVANEVSFCEGKKDNGQDDNSSQIKPQGTETAQYDTNYNDIDDDLPF